MKIRTTHPINRPWQRAVLALVAAACVAGCTTLGPDYQRPETALPAAWRAEITNGADLANTDWWQGFGDPDLDKLIDAAIDANKDLALALLRTEEFDAHLQVSRAANYPKVGYAVSASSERRSQERPNGLQPGASPDVANYELSTTFSWELDLWGRVKRSNEAALADLMSTQEARRGVMLTVVGNVATAYVQLLELDTRLDFAQRALKNREDALELQDRKWRGGSTTRLAVEQARAAMEISAAEIPFVERDIATLENALSGLLGRSGGKIQRRQLDALALPQMPAGVPADVLTRRPDVMAAEQSLIAANARIGVAKTEYFPTISLTAALGLGADDTRWLWAKTARTGNVGGSVVGTILSFGRIEGDIRAAEAVQKQTVVQYQQAVLTALREVDDALVSRTKAGQREAALGRQVGALQEVAKLSRLRYEGGQSTLMEVLDADLKVFTAQGTQAIGRRDTLLALVSVYKAMGGGWMLDQEQRRAPAAPAADLQAQAATGITKALK
jgi:outer membrane protein, multidrug efflux system